MRSHVRNALVVMLALGLLALFLRNADLRKVGEAIQGAQLDWLLGAIGVTLATYVLRAARWQYLLAPIGATRFSTAFRTTVIGFAVTFLLPARPGEFLRPYLLARREGLSATAAFATIVFERLLDTITVVLLLVAFLLVFDPGKAVADASLFRAVAVGGLAVGALTVALLVVSYFLAGHPEALGRATLGVERVLPGRMARKVAQLVRMFAEGLAVARHPGRLLAALLLSLPIWLSLAAGIWMVIRAFRLAVPYTGTFLLLPLLVLGVAVPTPGGVGGFHEAFRLGATAFYAAPNDMAIGAAIVLHAVSFVPVTLLGIFFTAQDGLRLGRLRSLAGVAAAEGEPG